MAAICSTLSWCAAKSLSNASCFLFMALMSVSLHLLKSSILSMSSLPANKSEKDGYKLANSERLSERQLFILHIKHLFSDYGQGELTNITIIHISCWIHVSEYVVFQLVLRTILSLETIPTAK